jgi:uncharacterized protein YbjT (DUF2867 family)
MVTKVLVVGSTGAQGGSVAAFLAKAGGYEVRGLTRDLQGKAAQALPAAGIKPFLGDLDDLTSLAAAMAGVDLVHVTVTVGLCCNELLGPLWR